MYWLILFSLVGVGGWLLRSRPPAPLRRFAGGLLLAATLAGFGLLSLWGELLWFEALGYSRRFWIFIGSQTGAALAGALLAAAVTALLTRPLTGARPARLAVLVSAAGGLAWGLSLWEYLLLYLNRVATGISDPLFGQDTGFYLFALPFYQKLHGLLLYASGVALGGCPARHL